MFIVNVRIVWIIDHAHSHSTNHQLVLVLPVTIKLCAVKKCQCSQNDAHPYNTYIVLHKYTPQPIYPHRYDPKLDYSPSTSWKMSVSTQKHFIHSWNVWSCYEDMFLETRYDKRCLGWHIWYILLDTISGLQIPLIYIGKYRVQVISNGTINIV